MGAVLWLVIIRDSLIAWEVHFSWFMAVLRGSFLFDAFLYVLETSHPLSIFRVHSNYWGIRSFVCDAMYGILSYVPDLRDLHYTVDIFSLDRNPDFREMKQALSQFLASNRCS